MRESAALFDLPAFDSLPAADGLSNLQAFQLSLRHALTLLPAMLARNEVEPQDEEGMEHPERFRLN